MTNHQPSVQTPEPKIRRRTRAGVSLAEVGTAQDLAAADYEVGYGRPPVRHQFQRGKSGNPRGRPKKSETVAEIAKAALNQKHLVKFGDKPTKKSIREIGVLHEAKKIAAGDPKAYERLRRMAGETDGPPVQGREVAARSELSPAEAEVLLAHYLSILLEAGLSEDNAIATVAKFGLGALTAESGQGEGGHA